MKLRLLELSSGTSSTLYGSEAFGGVVNIVTKQGQDVPRLNLGVQYGSFEQLNYRASYSGSADSLRYNFGYEQNEAENRYRVPVGAANRDSEGRLFNGDTAVSNYFGNLTFDLNPRNTFSLDAYKITSRRGLLYFGFPLQRDRLDHDALNVGLSWKTTDFTPSWLNLDLSARIPVTRNIGLIVYLENLADRRYEKANRIYHPGLTFRIGLQSTF